MNTSTKTLTLGSRFGQLYRPLIRNLALLVLGTVAIAGATLIYFDERLVESLSGRLMEKSTHTTEQKLKRLFDSASDGLRVALRQIDRLDLTDETDRKALYGVLAPFLEGYDFLDSINLADDRGNEFVIIKQTEGTLVRHADVDEPGMAHWQRYVDGTVVEEWRRQHDRSPLERPWYQGAAQAQPGAMFWTSPYKFLTTKEPGISVATRQKVPAGDRERVMAFNIALTEISAYTTRLRPTENGMIVIFGSEGETLGVPPDPRFADEADILSAVLTPVPSLGIPIVGEGFAAWERRGRAEGSFLFQSADRTPWWASLSSIDLGDGAKVWDMTLIPESDFLGALSRLRNLTLAGIGVVGLLVAGAILAISMRAIRRQMQAAIDQAERELGQYHLREKIGSGGNGAVYRARHALLRRPTAIKLMNPEFAGSEAARQRFEHEVQITSGLSHPNTIAIYDYGQTPDGTLYYAMELLNGSTLEQLVRITGPLPAGRVIHILAQIAGSLAEAHGKGLIHRDIKPSNAILCERGGLFDVVKVLDFGLVKEMAQVAGDLTHANVLIGTPLFMAPETISEPGRASPQSDLYALGAVGYFLLTARNVFDGGSAVEICAKHLNDPPTPPSERSGLPIADDLEQLILQCLAKDPADRPLSAGALRDQLLACNDADRWSQDDARHWWQTSSTAFTHPEGGAEGELLTKTELLVDFDHRALTETASRMPG